MPDNKTSAEDKANQEEIEHLNAIEPGPRGNVKRVDDKQADQDAPPPMPR